jgi:hypothetical protein
MIEWDIMVEGSENYVIALANYPSVWSSFEGKTGLLISANVSASVAVCASRASRRIVRVVNCVSGAMCWGLCSARAVCVNDACSVCHMVTWDPLCQYQIVRVDTWAR